jgi:hypothetical protein
MGIFTLSIETGNDAFAGAVGAEVARILTQLAYQVDAALPDDAQLVRRSEMAGGALRDFNGNVVGSWSYGVPATPPEAV